MDASTEKHCAASVSASEVLATLAGIEVLEVPIEWNRYCIKCDGEFLFVAKRICANGLIGRCSNCGDERIAPFTRTMEVA
jgi:hypothetical protein